MQSRVQIENIGGGIVVSIPPEVVRAGIGPIDDRVQVDLETDGSLLFGLTDPLVLVGVDAIIDGVNRIRRRQYAIEKEEFQPYVAELRVGEMVTGAGVSFGIAAIESGFSDAAGESTVRVTFFCRNDTGHPIQISSQQFTGESKTGERLGIDPDDPYSFGTLNLPSEQEAQSWFLLKADGLAAIHFNSRDFWHAAPTMTWPLGEDVPGVAVGNNPIYFPHRSSIERVHTIGL